MGLNFRQFYNFYRSLDLDDHELVQNTNGGIEIMMTVNQHFNGDVIIHKEITGHRKTPVYRMLFKNEQIRTWFQLKYPMVN